jgi:hypothetical protein
MPVAWESQSKNQVLAELHGLLKALHAIKEKAVTECKKP